MISRLAPEAHSERSTSRKRSQKNSTTARRFHVQRQRTLRFLRFVFVSKELIGQVVNALPSEQVWPSNVRNCPQSLPHWDKLSWRNRSTSDFFQRHLVNWLLLRFEHRNMSGSYGELWREGACYRKFSGLWRSPI